MKYFAFLRGINVGGTGIIKMEDLRKLFEDAGGSEVKTYIQSGNVKFAAKDAKVVCEKAGKALVKKMGKEIAIIIRTDDELKAILKKKPLKDTPTEKYYVVLMQTAPEKAKLPLHSKNKDVEITSILQTTALCTSYQYKGKWGFPNKFVEDTFKIPATTRNWKTIEKIVSMWS